MVGCVFPPIMCLSRHRVAAFLPLTRQSPYCQNSTCVCPMKMDDSLSGGCWTMERRRAEAGRARWGGRWGGYWEQSERKGMQTERGRESNERLIEDSKRAEDTIKMEEVGAHVEVFPMQTEPTTWRVSWRFGPGPNPKERENLLQGFQSESSVSNLLRST